MAEASEQQALDTISAEVDDAQKNVILMTHCIKAQAFLVHKLKKEAQRCKEQCVNISRANMSLHSEITNAEAEIRSLMMSKDTIRMANVELRKELLVSRENGLDVIERLKKGEEKYENMWLECKKRYERLPYVQKLQEATEKEKSLKDQIANFDEQAVSLAKEIETKKEACLKMDRQRIIELADYMVNVRPKLIRTANEKLEAITKLNNKLKNLNIETIAKEKGVKNDKAEFVEETTSLMSVDQNRNLDESALIMPKLLFDSMDLDDLISVKLDEIKMKKVDYTSDLERKESFSKSNFSICKTIANRRTDDIDESTSSYFSKHSDENKDDHYYSKKKLSNILGNVNIDANDDQYYSKKKLINILGDVKIDDNEAMDIISKVNPVTLQSIDTISAGDIPNKDTCVKNKVKEPIRSEEIEEVDMTSSITESIVKPPTQFLDESLRSQKSQEVKKTVSFDLASTSQCNTVIENTNEDITVDEKEDVTIDSQLDLGDADGRFIKIKEMELKKHNLDLTPPFVYGKNTNLQKMTENNVVTSKFFLNNEIPADEPNDGQKETENTTEILPEENEIEKEVPESIKQNTMMMNQNINSKANELDDKQDMVTSPKKPKIDDLFKSDKPFGGYLFKHGPQESLDLSMNTTGYEDGDLEFPHGIDSSLLLSPKADIPARNDNIEVESQETPNFLSGLRKRGLFFGYSSAGDSKTDSSASNKGSFNFNFSGEEKKNRAGLFSLFQ